MNRQKFDNYIKENDFAALFNEMGWNNARSVAPVIADVEEVRYKLECVAERNGFKVFVCEVDDIPLMTVVKLIDKRLRKSSNDYILIFVQEDQFHHEWIVPIKSIDKRTLVPVEYTTTAQLDFLYSKHEDFNFDIEEETTILDVTKKVHTAFEVNSEKVTKDFYAGFRKQHVQFAKFISGIDVEDDKQWYVSVMLNRLMFCYFIQKKNFLDFNPNYLRDKLNECKAQEGKDKFFKSFYKSFLIQLFHGGLNNPNHDSAEFHKKFGRIPYLNGGMFDEHQIERDYKNIDISDKAFEDIFDFFDKYRWHLDTRIEASGKDINPDVLGYIFEQYINDRAQMGAYYTKEDITGYIGKNCILPFLWDKTLSHAEPGSASPWTYLRHSGDTYIYDAVKHGLNDSNGNLRPLPPEIEEGVNTSKPNLLERRKCWNTPTEASFTLPTEIWRDTVDRRKRYIELCTKIKNGEIKCINDFITYNLDIISFTQDFLQKTDNIKLVLDFYHAMQNVTILDPTCGSGAFLFAAMNILEPLYDICLDRMEEIKNNPAIVAELNEIKKNYRSNRAYYIYKNIILKNLYGVDIMNEATEIAKLRIFLKMVAVVEADRRLPNLGLDPLPDIDFNIRCGNTLVGYANQQEVLKSFTDMFEKADWQAKIQNKVDEVAATYKVFKEWQLRQTDCMEDFKTAKRNLSQSLSELNNLLNKRLFGTRIYDRKDYDKWLKDTQPFHWFAEFYEIIHDNGGFDVIIGNPPYVEYTKKDPKTKKSISDIYKITGYLTEECGNLYAFVIERCFAILKNRNNLGMIVPLTLVSNNNMKLLRNLITEAGTCYASNYEIRPSSLFEGVEQRLTIFVVRNTDNNVIMTTAIQRWAKNCRSTLFEKIYYVASIKKETIWRFSNELEKDIFEKFSKHKEISYQLTTMKYNNSQCWYRTAGVRYWIIFSNRGFDSESLSNKKCYFQSSEKSKYYMAALNSNLFWWYYAVNYDMFNCKDYMIFAFRLNYNNNSKLESLANELEEDLLKNRQELITHSKTRGVVNSYVYKKRYSKPIIDLIDVVLSKYYGFTEEELDFIINYDIKYRMGGDLEED